jgi:hypothetical protein
MDSKIQPINNNDDVHSFDALFGNGPVKELTIPSCTKEYKVFQENPKQEKSTSNHDVDDSILPCLCFYDEPFGCPIPSCSSSIASNPTRHDGTKAKLWLYNNKGL